MEGGGILSGKEGFDRRSGFEELTELETLRYKEAMPSLEMPSLAMPSYQWSPGTLGMLFGRMS